MKIRIDNATKDEKIFEGEYSYLEGGKNEGKPSIEIYIRGEKEDYEVFFFCENEEELKELINDLKEIEESKNN